MEIRAISFECYGTLVDAEAGVRAFVARILARPHTSNVPRPTVEVWLARWERIRFQMLRPWRPYRELLVRSYDATMQFFGLEAFVDEGPALARAIGEWEPFPDATAALRRLAKRLRLAIVSNVDHELLGASVGRLMAPFSSLVTAEDARAYKPDPRPFALALERLGLPASSVLHVAHSRRDDLEPARALGLHTACVRGDDADAELRLPSLTALADALDH
jgi:2-haloalkanoic acid dehalogenase type II